MVFKHLIRWTALVTLAAMTTACGVGPSAGTALGKAGGMQAEARKPPVYEKIFPTPAKPAAYPVQIIAHRGYSKVAPENTLSAFQAALSAGVDAVELDVRITKDNQLVIMHDDDVGRTTDGEGPVDELTLEQIRALDAGSWFGPQFKGERVPTLDEALALIKGQATVVVEIKSRSSKRTPELVAESLIRHGMTDQAQVISFYEMPMFKSRELLPRTSTGALVAPMLSPTNRALSMRASSTLAFYKNVQRKTVEAAHRAGLRLNVWTVNEAEAMKGAIKNGVDGIITDDVALLKQVLEAEFNPQPPAPEPLPTSQPLPQLVP